MKRKKAVTPALITPARRRAEERYIQAAIWLTASNAARCSARNAYDKASAEFRDAETAVMLSRARSSRG